MSSRSSGMGEQQGDAASPWRHPAREGEAAGQVGKGRPNPERLLRIA
jgi:hypothetical protein